MVRSEERILTTHAGSLPRPPELVRLYVRRDAGRGGRPGGACNGRQGGPALGGAQADRRRDRRRQQRRAAARGLFPVRAAPDERLRRRLAPAAARRCRALPGLPAHARGADGQPDRGQQLSAAQGGRRGPLPRSGVRQCRMRGFPGSARRGRRRLRRAVPHRTLAWHRRRGDEKRILRLRGSVSRRPRGRATGRVRGDRR